jgi:NAD(P)-dependent dehydrogenase (short-subunit alcohol dehydrogenase family)
MGLLDAPGRVAIVTGANRGIGRAITVALAAGGFVVAASARDPASLAGTVTDAGEAGGTAVPFACDVRDEASVAKMAAGAQALGPVHAVVANAGVAGPTLPLHEITLEDWRDTLATDLDGVFLTFRAFIPGMIERRDGSLIAISSMTGKRPLHGRTPYAAAKMGVIGLVRTLATELGPYNIRVNAVCPGPTATPFSGAAPSPEVKARRAKKIPLGRMIEPEDIADAVLFLASPAASMVTGIALDVDGGVLISNDIPYEDYFARMQ